MEGAFITSYAIDINWFLTVFPKKIPLTLVKHYDPKIDKVIQEQTKNEFYRLF